jgi:hypothetical protein
MLLRMVANLDSSNPPASDFLVVGTTGMAHCTQPRVLIFEI